MGFGLLLRPNCFDPGPVTGKLCVASLVHVDFGGAAQASKCHHYATDFLLRVTLGPAKHVVDQSYGIVTATAVGLGQFKGFLQKTVGALCTVGPNRKWKAGFKPFFDTLLIRGNAHQFYPFTFDQPLPNKRKSDPDVRNRSHRRILGGSVEQRRHLARCSWISPSSVTDCFRYEQTHTRRLANGKDWSTAVLHLHRRRRRHSPPSRLQIGLSRAALRSGARKRPLVGTQLAGPDVRFSTRHRWHGVNWQLVRVRTGPAIGLTAWDGRHHLLWPERAISSGAMCAGYPRASARLPLLQGAVA